MHEMDWFEFQILQESAYMWNRDNWEQTRMLSYIIAQVNSPKRIKFEEFMPLPTKAGEHDEPEKILTKEELKQKAEAFEAEASKYLTLIQ